MNRSVLAAVAILLPLTAAACGNPTPCIDHTGARQPAMYCDNGTAGYQWADNDTHLRTTTRTATPAPRPQSKAPARPQQKAPAAPRRSK